MHLRRIEPVLRKALGSDGALEPGARLLVAVSGGADSTALLLGLCRVAHEFDLEIHAAHLHHRLRGLAADGDLAAVRTLCTRCGVPLHAARWNTRARMRRRGLAGQAGLRALRRGFLLATARRAGCAAIATAHTADDQLETLLLRLARGTGLPGLGGMRARNGLWIKPLLAAPRAWIEADLQTARVAWREDASNLDLRYARNRMRHRVVPMLAEMVARGRAPAASGAADVRVRERLAIRAYETALEAQEAAQVLDALVLRALFDYCRIQPGEIDLDSRKVAACPTALQRGILRAVWSGARADAPGLTARHMESLLRLLRGGRGGARIDLPSGWEASRGRGIVKLRQKAVSGAIDGQPCRECRPGPMNPSGAGRVTRRGTRHPGHPQGLAGPDGAK